MSAPWKEVLQLALKRNAKWRESKYVQLATVRPDGKPANRTVVYRGFLGETDKPTFVTDVRSHKVEEIALNPWGEVNWYFIDTREQFRLLGQLLVVTKDEQDESLQQARLAAWKNMSDPGRQQFGWPQPGLDRGEDDSIFKPQAPTADDPVTDTFCLVFMDVEGVDHLELAANQRHVYSKQQGGRGSEAEWVIRNVNP
ncbi:hypothetical protein N2152v2_002343 [Parachlorella kessleri]